MFKMTCYYDGAEILQHKWRVNVVTEADVRYWFADRYGYCDRLIGPKGEILASR